MATFNNPPFTEGEALSATNINTKAGTLLETPVNDLDVSSIERHALDAQHLPALSMSDIFSNGYEAYPFTSASTPETYNNTLPVTNPAGPVYPYTYQTFDGSAPAAPTIAYYGDTSGAGTYTYVGWRIVAHANLATQAAEIALNAATVLTTEGIKGVICRGSVEPYSGTLVQDTAVPARAYVGLNCVAIAIGWEDLTGNRYVVERSVRFYSLEACRQGNAGTTTFLTPTDTAAGDGSVLKIFLAIALVRPGEATTEGTVGRGITYTPDGGVEIKYYNLSVTPLQAGDL
mgnify:CR=1 FL=1